MYRPLILSSVSADLAKAQGVPVRLVGVGYLVALAVAVSLSAVDHWRDPLHGAPDRTGRHRPAHHQPDWSSRA